MIKIVGRLKIINRLFFSKLFSKKYAKVSEHLHTFLGIFHLFAKLPFSFSSWHFDETKHSQYLKEWEREQLKWAWTQVFLCWKSIYGGYSKMRNQLEVVKWGTHKERCWSSQNIFSTRCSNPIRLLFYAREQTLCVAFLQANWMSG